jgi:hypothetical protein
VRGQSDSASRIGLASQFAAPQVAGAIAKIQQALDRSGIQFKVRLEQDKVRLLAGGGLFDIRWLDSMLSVQGAGPGGGSLIYTNVFARP